MKWLLILAAAMVPAMAQTPPPSPPDWLTAEQRGIAGTGEMIGAAPACGLRRQDWAETLRSRMLAALGDAESALPRLVLLQTWARQMEAYGRAEAGSRRPEYCAFVGDRDAMRSLDRIVAGHREWWWR